MNGYKRVIEYLNKALCHELTAVNRYWLHYRLFDNWGYKELARTSRCNMLTHAHRTHHFLRESPNMQTLESIHIGKTAICCASALCLDYSHAKAALRSVGHMHDRSQLRVRGGCVPWRREFADTGGRINALGADPVGFVSYGVDGRVHAMLRTRRDKWGRCPLLARVGSRRCDSPDQQSVDNTARGDSNAERRQR